MKFYDLLGTWVNPICDSSDYDCFLAKHRYFVEVHNIKYPFSSLDACYKFMNAKQAHCKLHFQVYIPRTRHYVTYKIDTYLCKFSYQLKLEI